MNRTKAPQAATRGPVPRICGIGRLAGQ